MIAGFTKAADYCAYPVASFEAPHLTPVPVPGLG
jgi:succinylglutamic semialdehyde dehydrogenase